MDRKAVAFVFLLVLSCGVRGKPPEGPLGGLNPLRGRASRSGLVERIRFPRQITSSTSNDYSPRLTPDGRAVVYVSDRRGNPDLFIRFLRGSGSVGDYPLTFHTARDTSPSLSPNGEQVVFTSYRNDGRGDLYVLNLHQADRIPEAIRQRLYQRFGANLSAPKSGPADKSETAGRVEKFLATQGQLIRLTESPDGETEPAWSSDGERIFYTRVTQDGEDIYALRLPTKSSEQITKGGATMASPSPDGRWLAYVKPGRRGIQGGSLWLQNLGTGETRQISRGPFDLNPTWDDASSVLFFSRYADDSNGNGTVGMEDQPSIFSIRPLDAPALDSNLTRKTDGAGYDLFPDVRGDRLVFSSSENVSKGQSNLFLMNTSGLFPEKSGNRPGFETAESLFQIADERDETRPRTSALALEEVAVRWPDEASGAEARYRLGLLREQLGDRSEAARQWEIAGRSRHKKWALLSEIARTRLALNAALAKPQSAVERKTRVSESVRRLRTLGQTERSGEFAKVGAQAKLEEGRAWLQIGEEGDAVRAFDEVLTEFSAESDEAAQAMLGKIELYKKFSDRGKLIQGYLDLLRRYPRVQPWAGQAGDEALRLFLEESPTEATRDARLREVAATYSTTPVLPALALNTLGDRTRERGDATSAEAIYRSVITQFPGEKMQIARAQLALAQLFTQRGDYEEALALYRRAEGEIPRSSPWQKEARKRFVGSLLAKGRSELESKDLRPAIRTFRDLIAFDYTIPQAHRGLIFAYAALGETRTAISLYKEQVERFDEHYLPHYGLGLAYTFLDPPSRAFDLAEPELLEAISLNGQAVFPHQTLGFVYEKRHELLGQSDELEKAIDEYLLALSLSDPKDDFQNYGDLKLNVGNGYFLLKDYAKAYESYRDRESYDLPFFPRAQELVFLERYSRSAFHLSQHEVSVRLADKALALLGKMEAANELSAREILNHRAEIQDGRALALQEAGRKDEAAEAFAVVAELNRKLGRPTNEAKAYRNLAINLFEAPPQSGVDEERRLARARDLLDESLGMVREKGVTQTKEKKTGALFNINMDVSLGEDASEASKGFSKKGEEELLYTFIGRLERERGREAEALAAIEAKHAYLPAESSIDDTKRPAFLLKRSILSNQRAVLLARLGRFVDSAAAFRASWKDALSIPHEGGIAANALSMARLSQLAPEILPAKEAFSALRTALERLKERSEPSMAVWSAELSLAHLRLLDLTTVDLSFEKPEALEPLTFSLRSIREAGKRLNALEGKDPATLALALELDLHHFFWTGHRVRRSTEKNGWAVLEGEAQQLKRMDLVLLAKALAVRAIHARTLEELQSAMEPLLAFLDSTPLSSVRGQISVLSPIFQHQMDLALAFKNAESAFDASEWMSRLRLAAAQEGVPTFFDSQAPDLPRGLASLDQLNIVAAAELMETLGPNRSFVRWVGGPSGSFTLVLTDKDLSLRPVSEPFTGSVRDTYIVPGTPCPSKAGCARVASGAHLFYALSALRLVEKRSFVPNATGPSQESFETVSYGGRSDFLKKRGLADRFVAPVLLDPASSSLTLSPLALRFQLQNPTLSRFDRDFPAADLLSAGATTVSISRLNWSENDLALLAEWWARGGIANVKIATDPPSSTRTADFGAWGYTDDERKERAQEALASSLEEAAALYRAERWGEAVRRFDEALTLIPVVGSSDVSRDQILDAASTAAYRGEDLPLAERLAQDLVNERKAVGGKPLGQALQFLGVLQSRMEKYAPAIANLKAAAEIFEKVGDAKPLLAESLVTLGIVHENAQQYRNALTYFDRSLEIHSAAQSAKGIGEQWRRIGRIYYLRLNDYGRAREAFEKAVAAFERDKASALVDEARLELGLVAERRGAFQEALGHYQGVHARAEKAKDLALVSKASLYISNVHWFQGNYFEAFRSQRRALDAATAAKDKRMLLLCHSTAGLIYWTLNQHDKSLAEQTEALSLSQAIESTIDEASAYNNMGLVYRERGKAEDLTRSIEFFQRALALDRKLQSVWGMAYDRRNLGISYMKQGRYADSEKQLQESATLSQKIGAKINEAKAYQSLGDVALLQKKYDEAHTAFQAALKLSREHHLKEVEWRALQGLARIAIGRSNDEGARVFLEQAISLVEGISAEIKVEEFRNGFITNKLELYEDMVLLLLRQGSNRYAEAWNYVERARSRNFLDLLGNRSIQPRAPEDRSLLEKDRLSRRTLDDLENALAAARAEDERKGLVAKLQAARTGRENLLIEIRARRPELSSFVSVDVLSLPQLRSLLGEDTGLVEYFLTSHELLAWVITDRTLEVIRVPVEKRALEEKIVRYSKLMQEQQPLIKESEELYSLLWKPVSEKLQGKRYVGISPHETLHYLSFASLFDGKRYLIDRLPLFYTPSASVLKFTLTGETAARADVRVLAIGNPDLGNAALDLPFAEKEVGAIARNFPKIDVLTRERATERWVVDNIAKYNVIHLASHGEFDPINPLFSAIKLAPSAGNSGDLRVEDVFGLKLQADLVTLSACQTGLAKVEGGGELVGLNRAFLYAGTHSILSSLWRVSDVSTAVLVKHFYRNYVQDSKADSLRKAQLLVKDYYPHPSYWAALSLTGNFR